MNTLKMILIGMILTTAVGAGQNFNYVREWATYYGGEDTKVLDDAIDSEGNVYIVGLMEGEANYLSIFITDNAFQQAYGGGETDGFIAKFDSQGLLIWSSFFGGSEADVINSITIDSQNRIFIAGVTASSDLATPGAHSEIISGMEDAFIGEFTSTGERMWSSYYGGTYNDSFSGIQSDNLGNLYLFGSTSSQQSITTPASYNENFVANVDFVDPATDFKNFISKFTDTGSRIWSTYYGTNTSNARRSYITGITLNDTGVFVVGWAFDVSPNTYFATPGCHQPFNSNAAGIGIDIFLTKFSFEGTRIWSTYFGGSNSDKSVGYNGSYEVTNLRNVIATRDFVYIAGATNSNNNVATPGAFQATMTDYSHFIAKFSNLGVKQWGTYYGNDTAFANGNNLSGQYAMLNLDSNENVFISGCSNFNDLASSDSYQPVTSSPDPTGAIHVSDSFVAKMSNDGTTRYFGTYYGGHEYELGANTLLSNNSFYIVGTTNSTQNISTENSYQHALSTNSENQGIHPANAFIAKFIEIPLNINGATLNNVVVFPNPNNGKFFLNLNANYLGSRIAIFDITGKKIFSSNVTAISQEINCPNMANGTYILKITNISGNEYERKIVID